MIARPYLFKGRLRNYRIKRVAIKTLEDAVESINQGEVEKQEPVFPQLENPSIKKFNWEYKGKKYSFEKKGNSLVKTYSKTYSLAYHHSLNQQIENQFKSAIQHLGDLLFTAWILGGQSDFK